MDKLDDSEKQTIDLLQIKVDPYQNDPILCSELNFEQYKILVELQTIYNILNKITLSNNPSLYNNLCKGVRNEMKNFITIYSNMTAKELYINYIEKYQAAKKEPNKLNQFFDIS